MSGTSASAREDDTADAAADHAEVAEADARATADGKADAEPPSRLARAWWWASDYVYAARRQLSILAPPWTIGRPRPEPGGWRRGSPDLPEIILLPGVYEHWTFMRPLGDALSQAGHRVTVVHGLGVNRRGVVETSERLGRALAKKRPAPAGRVIVAHSKGGLIGKHLLISSGAATAAAAQAVTGGDPAEAAASAPAPDAASTDARPLGLLGLVAVCTPFKGSRLARYLVDPSVRAMLPNDETIVTLGRDSSVNGRIVSVFGGYDPHIPDGSMLEGATNVQVPAVGHFAVLAARATHLAVLDGVRMLSTR
ncbi:esterase/lipase family protein [Microbacterium sp. DT81.1]|uniref:esterase/lipase family protein n=1 Tax=Microbacterium sp. DT81.1 TaxID=3393413 RepID=UPI003CF5A64C